MEVIALRGAGLSSGALSFSDRHSSGGLSSEKSVSVTSFSANPDTCKLAYRHGEQRFVSSFIGNNHQGGMGYAYNTTNYCFGLKAGSRQHRVQMNLGHGGEADDEEYVEAHVVDAVRMVPVKNQLFMTMATGTEVEVVHVNPTAGRLLYQTSTPTIFLKMTDNSELMLPIVVGELAIGLLMKAFRQEQTARPNCYELMKEMVGSLNHEVRMVKVTQRIVDTYYARIYISKPGSNSLISIDARPSDAINLAVRCQVPIFVSKSIVMNDCVKMAYSPTYDGGRSVRSAAPAKDLLLDSPLGEHDVMAEEMSLVRNMMAAVTDERYNDAARLRDQLNTLRQGSRRQLHKH